MRQLLRATSGTTPRDIRAVFLTHLHGDHCYGIPGLGMSVYENARETHPHLYTPKGLEQCFAGPLGLRGFHVHPIMKPSALPGEAEREGAVDVFLDRESNCYHLYEDDVCTVKAQVIRHSVFCLGFVVEEKLRPRRFLEERMAALGIKGSRALRPLLDGHPITLPDGRTIHPDDIMEPQRRPRKLVILGDTCDPRSLLPLAMDADVLVHEATYTNEERHLAVQYMHSTAGMAGLFARQIRAKHLILTHFSPRNFGSDDYLECLHVGSLVEEARKAFGRNEVYPAHVRSRPPNVSRAHV